MQANGNKRCSPATTEVTARAAWHGLLKACAQGERRFRPIQYRDSINDTEHTLFALAQAVEQRDRHTGGHCERLAYISVALGVAMGLKRASLMALHRGGYVHDVGKVGIPDSILFKPGRLTAQEWVVMRSHTARGEEICRHLKSFKPVLPIIRHHHERWDGSGYPDGLRGEQIPLLARIVQIADIYDALTNPRPYKPAYHSAEALAILRDETKRGWCDPHIFPLFERLHSEILMRMSDFSGGEEGVASLRESLFSLQHSISDEIDPPLKYAE